MAIYLIDEFSLLVGPIECPEVPGMGKPVPGNAVELPEELPPPDQKHLWAWIDKSPKQMPDRRGTVYHMKTGAPFEWRGPREIPEIYTDKPWPGRFFVWVDDEWQLDEQAQFQSLSQQALVDRDALLAIAAIRIAPLQDAVDLEKATGEEKAALLKWKGYRVNLNRIEDQEGFPLEFDWPTAPELRNSR